MMKLFYTNIETFLTWVAYHKAKVFQVGVKTAFLYGKLNNTELYVGQLEGFYNDKIKMKSTNSKKGNISSQTSCKFCNEEIENTLEA